MNASTPTKVSSRKRKVSIISMLLLFVVVATAAVVFAVNHHHGMCDDDDQEDIARIFVTSEVDTALLAYKTNTGSYPTTKQGLQALLTPPEGVKGWRGPYFTTKSVPKDPWGHPYQYAYPSTHGQPAGKYDCWSLGPDGKDGTTDDIGNWPES